MSDSPGLVDFAIGLVNPVLNLPEGYSNNRRTVINAAHQKFFGATYKTLGLVHTSNNLPVRPTFFAPCIMHGFQV